MCSVGHMTTRCLEQVGMDANKSLGANSTQWCLLHADVLEFGYKQKAHHDFSPNPHLFFSSCPPSRSHDVKTPAPFLCVWQDNKAMNMFGMDHMLKDGWSGWYSQGYMYFDNCSSLFLPKVWVRRLVTRREVYPQCPLTSSHLSPRFTTQTSTPISPSAAPRSVTAPLPLWWIKHWTEKRIYIYSIVSSPHCCVLFSV